MDCPTNGDPAYDVLKIKRTTGIPKSQLVRVESADVPGAMLNADGTYSIYKSQVSVVLSKLNSTLALLQCYAAIKRLSDIHAHSLLAKIQHCPHSCSPIV